MTTFTLKIPGVGPVQVSIPGQLNVVVPVERVGDHFVVVQRSVHAAGDMTTCGHTCTQSNNPLVGLAVRSPPRERQT